MDSATKRECSSSLSLGDLHFLSFGLRVVGTEMEAVSTAAATSGNLFRYDSENGQYVFNLGTESLSEGTWRLRIDLGDGELHTVDIGLR